MWHTAPVASRSLRVTSDLLKLRVCRVKPLWVSCMCRPRKSRHQILLLVDAEGFFVGCFGQGVRSSDSSNGRETRIHFCPWVDGLTG